MSTQTDIYNMALAAIGISRFVNSPNEGSTQANMCNVFWESVRDQCLQESQWSFATRFASLALISKVTTGWLYTYAYPSDCVQARSIFPASMTVSNTQNPINYPFAVVDNEAGGALAIASNEYTPTLSYTARIKSIALWPPSFVNAVSLLLATKIVAPLSSAPDKYGPLVGRAYEAAILKASALSMNEGQNKEIPESEFINARD